MPGISVGIVCFTPAGESLINSGLVHSLPNGLEERKKGKKGGMQEGRKRKGGTRNGWSDKEPYVLYLGTYGLARGS